MAIGYDDNEIKIIKFYFAFRLNDLENIDLIFSNNNEKMLSKQSYQSNNHVQIHTQTHTSLIAFINF